MDKGFIFLYRILKENWIWKSEKRLKWWVDILFTVNYKDKKVPVGNSFIECTRGQSIKSLESWAKDWNTSKKTVRNFFILLENDGMIKVENIKFSTKITVCKYDFYQNLTNNTDKGYISLYRKLKEHWIWKSDNHFKWWLDILLTVNFINGKRHNGNSLIKCNRGQSIRSLESWAKDWNITKKAVRDFLIILQNEGMIKIKNLKFSTRITVCNYGSYQNNGNDKETESKQDGNDKETESKQDGNDKETESKRQGYTNNKDNNVNNENNENKGNKGKGGKEKIPSHPLSSPLVFNEFSKVNLYSIEEIKQVVISFNNICSLLTKVKKLTEDRIDKINFLLKEYGLKDILKVFRYINENDFYTGSNDRSWSANFDFIIVEKNFIKAWEESDNE